MNFALELQKDKELCKGSLSEPFKIVSLWDMLRFYTSAFLKICDQLAIMETIIDHANGLVQPIALQDMKESFINIPEALRIMELNVAKRHAEDFVALLNSDEAFDVQDFKQRANTFRWSFIYELEERLMLLVSASRADSYDCEETFLGEKIIRKFQMLKEDAAEAGNCFALARYTACVFHLMRIMERIVHRLGQKQKIKIKDLHKKTWGQILNEVRTPINRMAYDTASQRKKKDRYQNSYAL